MIGWISDVGLWLVDGADTDALPIGAAVVTAVDADGAPVEPADAAGAQVRTELGWAGPEELGDTLTAGVTYRVLWPINAQRLDGWPATSRAQFEQALTRFLGDSGAADEITVDHMPTRVSVSSTRTATGTVATASCSHGGPVRRLHYGSQMGGSQAPAWSASSVSSAVPGSVA